MAVGIRVDGSQLRSGWMGVSYLLVVVALQVPESLWFCLPVKCPDPFLLVLWMSVAINGHPKKLTSILLFPTDITDARSWERENAGTQADESSPSALQRAAWGVSETESDLTYGEVEQRLDLLQEQLNRYKQFQAKE